MVEAAIFMPIIILGVMFVVYMLINMYQMTALRTHAHLVVRADAAIASGQTVCEIKGTFIPDRYRAAAESKAVETSETQKNGVTCKEASVAEVWKGGLLTRSDLPASYYGRNYVLDDTAKARLYATVEGLIGQ
jgi:hypothetical protein